MTYATSPLAKSRLLLSSYVEFFLADPNASRVNAKPSFLSLVSEKVEGKGLAVKAVLLIGGFGASRYLHHRLENGNKIKHQKIQVIQNADAWSSVCRGATLWGLEHSDRAHARGIPPTVKSRIARHSYGICMNMDFDSNIHTSDDGGYDESGRYVAKDHMYWLIEKGDRMEEGREIDRKMTESVQIGRRHVLSFSKQDFHQKLWFCERDTPPRRFNPDTINELCELEYNIRKGKLVRENKGRRGAFGGRFRDIEFTLSILLGSANLEFLVKYHDGEIARCKAKYMEDKYRFASSAVPMEKGPSTAWAVLIDDDASTLA